MAKSRLSNRASDVSTLQAWNIIISIFDSVNHTRFPKEDHIPDCASRDNQVRKGDRVECLELIKCRFINPNKQNCGVK